MQVLQRAAASRPADSGRSVPYSLRHRPWFDVSRLTPFGSVRFPAPIAHVDLVWYGSNQNFN